MPIKKGYIFKSLKERFWSKVNKTENCWLWIGVADSCGYGAIRDRGKMRSAHRVSWELNIGEITPGLEVCHHCDNAQCVNPNHLYLGTHKENMLDSKKKNKSIFAIRQDGENNNNAKLSKSQIIAIRNDKRPNIIIAKEYGVCETSIYYIKKGITWKTILGAQ